MTDSERTPVVDDVQVALHDYASEAVPAAQRKNAYQLIVVAIGWAISVSAFLVGGVLGGGLRFGPGVTAILIGNAVLGAVASLIGLIGYRTGLTSYLIARAVFGRVGSVLVSIVLGVLAMGFIGVLLDAFGDAFTALVSAIPWTVVVILFTVAVTLTALFGFRGLAWISVAASPALLILALLGLGRIAASEGGFSAAMNSTPAEPVPFTVGITAVIATWITGAALTSDIARFARRGSHVVVASFIAYVGGAGLFEFSAMVSATEAGTSDFVAAMSTLGLLLPAVIVLVLALWTTTDNNLYSASLAFTNASALVGREIPKPVWTLVSTAIALGVAFLGFASNFLSFLQIIAVVTPPFAGVVITHYWVLGHIRSDPTMALADLPAIRLSAAGSWLATSLLASFVALPVEPLAALLIGGAIYGIVGALLDRSPDVSPSTQRAA